MKDDKLGLMRSFSSQRFFFGLTLVILTIPICSATIFFQDGLEITGDMLIPSMNNSTNISPNPFPIQFFYNTHCGSCQESVQYLNDFKTKYPEIQIDYHDLFNNTTSFALYEEYKIWFNRSDLHYPVIFMGNVGIMGTGDIATYTGPLTIWYQKNQKKDNTNEFFDWIISLLYGKRS